MTRYSSAGAELPPFVMRFHLPLLRQSFVDDRDWMDLDAAFGHVWCGAV